MNGMENEKEGRWELPQSTVLGPLLWKLVYDAVLRTSQPSDLSIVCYAYDTLLQARGLCFEEVLRRAEQGILYCIVEKICIQGLRLTPQKNELHDMMTDMVPWPA